MSTRKLCIYTDYMVTFENSVWMYYIKKLNNGEYPPDRKRLSVKYDSATLGFSPLWILRV
jgi:hypothetical protein